MRPTIVIDPGHGGEVAAGRSSAHGATGPSGTAEKTINLALARRVVHHLGAAACLTRRGDENVALAERAALARRSGARVFVSLHVHDHADRGSEVFVHTQASGSSQALGRALQGALGRHGGGGVRAAEMAVLAPEHHAPETAACLLELDGLGHAQGERRLGDPAEVDRLARRIAEGVRHHIGRPKAAPARLSQEEIQALAVQQIDDLGGLTVAMHITRAGAGLANEKRPWGSKEYIKDEDGAYDEFKRQAQQFAADHQAIGVADDGTLTAGEAGAMEITRTVPELLAALETALDLRGEDGVPQPLRIKTIAFFTHGWEHNLKIHVEDGTDARGKQTKIAKTPGRGQYKPLYAAIAGYLSASPRVLLYACLTAADVADGFAGGLTQDLGKWLAEREGAENPTQVELWGHSVSGNTAGNHCLVRFLGAADTSAAAQRDAIHNFLAASFLGAVDRQFAAPAAGGEERRKKLARQVLGALDVESNTPTNARLVFNRDLPFVGLELLAATLEYDWFNNSSSGDELAASLPSTTAEAARRSFSAGYADVARRLIKRYDEAWDEAWKQASAGARAAARVPAGVTARRK